MKAYITLITFVSLLHINLNAQTSALLGYDGNGKLTYNADARGNLIPDFSYVGYHHSEQDIPMVPVVKTISAVGGDNLSNIQNAINEVESMTPDANGYRGAILLQSGTYVVSNTLHVEKSGIVIRGEGTSTIVRTTRTEQHSLFEFTGSGGTSDVGSSEKEITDSYVAIGARSFTIESGHSFQVGDHIYLERKPNQAWINMLGTHNLSQSDPGDTDWTPSGYTMKYKRVITGVNGNVITIDAPVVDPIDDQYATGSIYKYNWSNKLEECGIENMRLESSYTSDSDENHGWHAVSFTNAENCWATDVDAYYFGYSCMNIGSSCYKITVDNCRMIDPKSQTTGGRKYSFNCNGQQILFKNCYARGGRHDYVSGARVPGPNTFVNCISENQKSTTGPHHRWATGQLYDNVSGDKDFAAENRGHSGSGHGWAGAQIMFWNCTTTTKFVLHDPPSDHINWCIGCTGSITNNGFEETEPLGYVESQNTPLLPQSLFEKQLCDRLNTCGGVAQSPYHGTPHTIPGTIQMEEYDLGGNGVAYYDSDAGNTGNSFRTDDVDIGTNTDGSGGYNLGWVADNEWLEYTVEVSESGYYDFTVRGSSDNVDGGGIHIEFDGVDLTTRIQINNTGGWQNYQDFSASSILLTQGQYTMRVFVEEGSINLNYVQVVASPLDCIGDPNGLATLDGCGICSGGNSGVVANANCPLVTDLSLIDEDVDEVISDFTPLTNNDVINLNNVTNGLFNIFANVTNDPDSVVFNYDLNGDVGKRKEQSAPYAIRGDGSGYNDWSLTVGDYTVNVKVYLNGLISDEVSLYFSVIQPPIDCHGDENGTASIDACGVCSGGNTGVVASSPSTWYEDSDNDGLGDPASSVSDCEQPNGYVENSNDLCPNDNTNTCNDPIDCNGDVNGTASIDQCGACSGGNTGVPIDDCVLSTNYSVVNQEVVVYPNPSSGTFFLKNANEGYWVVKNIVGNVIIVGNGQFVDLISSSSGMYFLEINGQVIRLLKD